MRVPKVTLPDATGLVIDDDEAVRDLVSRLMTAMEFKQVWTASDGSEGLRIAAECRPSVIVCDIDMTPIDGVMVVAGIRFSLDKELSKTPIMIFSSHPNLGIIETLKNLGISIFIAKPFVLGLFATRINDAIEMGLDKEDIALSIMRWQFGDDAYS